jgi:hypothetical protein
MLTGPPPKIHGTRDILTALVSPFMDAEDALLGVSLAIGVLMASVLARHLGVGIGGGRRRVRAADGHKSVGSSQ